MRTAIVEAPIDTSALTAEVARHANGATVVFIGTVRDVNDGRAVSGMEYTAYRSMAEREMADIVREACAQFGTSDIVVEHRIGMLELGDASVVIAVAHPHRGAAYDASRYVIEQLKQRVPIWKREAYVDGTREWVQAGSGNREAGRGGKGSEGRRTPDLVNSGRAKAKS
jgi:molybdopterin synthase catalytic subunit